PACAPASPGCSRTDAPLCLARLRDGGGRGAALDLPARSSVSVARRAALADARRRRAGVRLASLPAPELARRDSPIPTPVPEAGDGEQHDPDRTDAREELDAHAGRRSERQPLQDEQPTEQ